MPKLARLRFVSIGHSNARMQDLTLNFCDSAGSPSDSTIWLRNGGGKSSILSLFFAMLRPNRRDFLGTRADGGERRLEQYILRTDRSVVAAEWVLDNPSSLGLEESEPIRFLTGVFYEYSVTKADTLNRLFFCARQDQDVEETLLPTIPIDMLNATGARVRRTLTSFKQKWHELAEAHPNLRMESTDNQSTWNELLQREGIDPGLFGYQLTMNMREGGADELFRFKTAEDFVDFLLQLSVESNKADEITANLDTFRGQLRRRKHEFMPDLDLSTGLIERLTPLVELHEKRVKTQEEAKKLGRLSIQLGKSIEQGDHAFGVELSRIETTRASAVSEKTHLDDRVHTLRGYASAMSYLMGEQDVKKHKRFVEQIKLDMNNAEHQVDLWNAAYPYREFVLRQQDVEALKLQLSGTQDRKAPLMEKLEAVASDLVAALKHQSKRLRDRQQSVREQFEDKDAESRLIDQEAAKCINAATAFEAEARTYRLNLDKRDSQYGKLINLKVIQPNETPEEAYDRLIAAKKNLETKLRSSENRRSGDGDMIDELDRQKSDLQAAAATHAAELRSAKAEYEKAVKEREKFENDSAFMQCLEVESVSVEELADDTSTMLTRRAAEVGEQCARLRTEIAALERARVHLQDRGLMPPSVEVEALLSFLSEKTNAVSGWSYINEQIPGDASLKRQLIREFPAVAQGIIVPAEELDRVKQLLTKNQDKVPPLPIVIAAPSVFDTNEPENRSIFVTGPKNDAWFDKTSAAAELASLELKLTQIREDVRKFQSMQDNFTKSALKFSQFRSLYPRGFFQSKRALITKLTSVYEDEQARLQDVVDDLRRYNENRRSAVSVEDQIKADIQNIDVMLTRLQSFTEEDQSNIETWQNSMDDAMLKAQNERDKAETLRAQAEEIREEARRISKQAEPYAEEARILENECNTIRYVKKQPEPKAGSLDELRSRYATLIEQVEHELGNQELVRRLKDAEEQVKKRKVELDRCMKKGVTLDEVKTAVEALSNPNDIDLNKERAEELVRVFRARLSDANMKLGEIETTFKIKQQAWLGFGKPTLPAELEQNISAESIQNLEDEVRQTIERINTLERQMVELDRKNSDVLHQREALKKDAQRLRDVHKNFADFFSALKTDETLEFTPIEVTEISSVIDNLSERLNTYKDVHASLDTTRRTLVSAVRKWVENVAFAELQSRIVSQFKSLDAEAIEESASEYRDQLSLRVTQLQETLSDIDEHRIILAKLLLNAANDGLRLLKLADTASVVPDEIPGIGGERFLRITSKEPSSQKEKLDLIQELVDTIVDEQTLPTGIKLIQRAVRQIAAPFTIRVLNPATSAAQHYIEINQTARFSGGEQMTCAILLYCTLANVRARTRGLNRQPTSVLLLDNPVGRASRVSFITMQRQFASAMGIQLVYTTGLHDLDALGVIPNVIRLRNELIDRVHNHHLVENESEALSKIDAMHVARTEERAVRLNDISLDDIEKNTSEFED